MAAAKRENAYLVVIVVLLVTLAYSFSQTTLTAAGQQAAVDSVKSVYELLTENPAEVISVNEQSGIYRILLRTRNAAGTTNVQEVFVTKDGSLITDRVINATGFAQQLTKEKTFAECLASNRVIVAGVSNDTNTVAQLQVLGSYSYKVFVDCSGANLQLCQSAGIQQVPTIVVGNQSVTGVQPLSFFQQATGCTL